MLCCRMFVLACECTYSCQINNSQNLFLLAAGLRSRVAVERAPAAVGPSMICGPLVLQCSTHSNVPLNLPRRVVNHFREECCLYAGHVAKVGGCCQVIPGYAATSGKSLVHLY